MISFNLLHRGAEGSSRRDDPARFLWIAAATLARSGQAIVGRQDRAASRSGKHVLR